MAHADLTILPLGTADPSVSRHVAAMQRHLAQQDDVAYRLHAMGTTLEGSVADVLRVAGELHALPFDDGVQRVYTVVKLDERRDKPGQTLDDKVASVEEKLAEG